EPQRLQPHGLAGSPPADLEALPLQRHLDDLLSRRVALAVAARLDGDRLPRVAARETLGLLLGIGEAQGDQVSTRSRLQALLAEGWAGTLGPAHLALVRQQQLRPVLALVFRHRHLAG